MVGFLEFLEGDADGAPCERARFKRVPAADCRGRCAILGVEEVVRPPRVGEGKGEGGNAPRPFNKTRLRFSTSLRSATFSFLDDPSSFRIASKSRSRSAISPSSVEMYYVLVVC